MNSTPTLPSGASGYSPTDDYVAQQTKQGCRTHYALALPIFQVAAILPIPDPQVPFEDNRQVVESHAKAFATYVFDNENWHSGPLTVRTTSETVKFTAFPGGNYGELTLGMLEIPRSERKSFSIIDGQHRVLGFFTLESNLNHELVKQRGLLAAAERNGEPTGSIYRAEIDKLIKNLDRLKRESIVIDLVIVDESKEARQVFVDVAANQKGITKSVQGRFDQRKVANRALSILLDEQGASPLLNGKVETEKSGVSGRSPYLLSAGTLADIARILQTGITGKVSAAQERSASNDVGVARSYATTAQRFFNVLAGAFPDLTDIANGKNPADLRDSSLVVSTTMLRILAGVFHNLEGDGLGDADITLFFSRVAKHVSAPIDAKTPSGVLWIGAAPATAAFTDGTTAPGARAQQVKELVEAITGWNTNPPPEL